MLLSSNLQGLILWGFFPPYTFIPYLSSFNKYGTFYFSSCYEQSHKKINGKNKFLVSFCYSINAILQTDRDTGNLQFQVWPLHKEYLAHILLCYVSYIGSSINFHQYTAEEGWNATRLLQALPEKDLLLG